MVKIRLQRRGRKKRPIHHIVVADSRAPRDGRIIEDLGRFDNIPLKNELTLNEERAIYWLQQGAQPSNTVRSILKKQGIMYKLHLMRWGKTEEEIEEALNEWREAREAKEGETPSKKERQQAMLEAEEKEYQKQLKKKAEEAAKEKAKQKALAAKEAEEKEAAAAAEEEKNKEASVEAEKKAAAEASTEAEQKTEAKAEEESETKEEVKAEEETAPEAEVEEEKEPETEEKAEKEKEASEGKQEEPEEDTASAEKTSTNMLAKEAIDHIENTPVEELEGFVTDEEDRVTVKRALEEKQEEQ